MNINSRSPDQMKGILLRFIFLIFIRHSIDLLFHLKQNFDFDPTTAMRLIFDNYIQILSRIDHRDILEQMISFLCSVYGPIPLCKGVDLSLSEENAVIIKYDKSEARAFDFLFAMYEEYSAKQQADSEILNGLCLTQLESDQIKIRHLEQELREKKIRKQIIIH